MNGDGYADVVVGAYGYGSYSGRAYLYLGRPSGLATTPATTLTGEAAGDWFGYSAATAGDVNGDGYDDVVSGQISTAVPPGGRICIWGAERPGDDAGDDPDAQGGQRLLRLVGGDGGDVNGDGYADVVVGALEDSSITGRAYLYLGGAGGLATTEAATLTGEAADSGFGGRWPQRGT